MKSGKSRHQICVHEGGVEDSASLDGGYLQVNGRYVFLEGVPQNFHGRKRSETYFKQTWIWLSD